MANRTERQNPLALQGPRHISSTQVMAIADIQAAMAACGDTLDLDFHERETLAPPPPDSDAER